MGSDETTTRLFHEHRGDERSSPFACSHPQTGIRLATRSNGSEVVITQCLRCGGNVKALKKAGFDTSTLPREDRTIREMFSRLARSCETQYRIARLADWKERSGVKREEYDEYLQSEEWRALRKLVMERAKGRCEGCGIRLATEVHHTTYTHIFREFLFELLALCRECHERFHANS